MTEPELRAAEPRCPGHCHEGDWRDFDHYCDTAGIQAGEESAAFAAWRHALTGWDGLCGPIGELPEGTVR